MASASSGKKRMVAINPFWSDTVKGEAILRSLRPLSLPPSRERGRGREGCGLPIGALKVGPEVEEALP